MENRASGLLLPETTGQLVSYLNRLFIMSYPFSQGSPQTQREIFKYIHAKRPDLTVDEKSFVKLEELSSSAVAKFFRGMLLEDIDGSRNIIHQPYHMAQDESIEPITHDNTRGIVFDELKNYSAILNGEVDTSYSIEQITKDLIQQDLEYLKRPSGRPRVFVVDKRTSSPLVDPWFSYYCYYSILGNSTGLSEFDELAQDIKRTVLENPHEFSDFVAEIIRLYNLKHSSRPIVIEEEALASF